MTIFFEFGLPDFGKFDINRLEEKRLKYLWPLFGLKWFFR